MITELFRCSGASILAMFGTASGELLTEHTLSLPTVVSVGVVVWTGAWYISRQFTKLEDRIDTVEKSLRSMPCTKVPVVALATVKCDIIEPKP